MAIIIISKLLNTIDRILLSKKTIIILFFIGIFSLPYILYLSLGLLVLKTNLITIISSLFAFVFIFVASFFRTRFLSTGASITLLLIGLTILPFFILSVLDLVKFTFLHTLITLFGYGLFLSCTIISFFQKRFVYTSFIGIGFLGLGLFLESRSWREESKELCDGMRSDIYCIEGKEVFDCAEQSSFGAIYMRSSVCSHRLAPEERALNNKKKRKQQEKKDIEGRT